MTKDQKVLVIIHVGQAFVLKGQFDYTFLWISSTISLKVLSVNHAAPPTFILQLTFNLFPNTVWTKLWLHVQYAL